MNIQFARCTSQGLDNVPMSNGQIIFVKDTNEQYLDSDMGRNRITDIVLVPDSEALSRIVIPISGKLYYVISENSIKFFCNNKWQEINHVDMENLLTKDNTTPYTPTQDYNPATKKYVDDSVSVEVAKNFSRSFTKEDWVLSGQEYTLTIPQSQHLLTNPFITSLDMLDNNEFKSVTMYGSKLLPNGSLVILSDLTYDGRVLLRGGI